MIRILMRIENSLQMINPLECFFGSKGQVALDENLGPGYNILLMGLIPDLYCSSRAHRRFHILPCLLHSGYKKLYTHYKTSILMAACQTWRQLAPFLWSLV